MERFSPKVRVGVRGFEHATDTVRLALIRLLSWSALRARLKRVSIRGSDRHIRKHQST